MTILRSKCQSLTDDAYNVAVMTSMHDCHVKAMAALLTLEQVVPVVLEIMSGCNNLLRIQFWMKACK